MVGVGDWQHRLHEFDYVILTAALTGQSRHLLGEAEFKSMQPEAWVFNVARGGLIDHDALAQALHAGRPRGAYLDVTDPEPLPRNHPLWQAPNVVITGHSSRPQRTLARAICHPVSRQPAALSSGTTAIESGRLLRWLLTQGGFPR